jgi:hypothetical protein
MSNAVVCWLVALAVTGALEAQPVLRSPAEPGARMTLHRFPQPPSDADWAAVTPLPLVMREPVFGEPMTERTDIRVAHDAEYLYLRALLEDDTPDGIRANSLYRDRMSGDDLLGIVLDPFDDRQSGLWFWTTPAGVRGDAEIAADGGSVKPSVTAAAS